MKSVLCVNAYLPARNNMYRVQIYDYVFIIRVCRRSQKCILIIIRKMPELQFYVNTVKK